MVIEEIIFALFIFMENDSLKTLGERIKYALDHYPGGPKNQQWLREAMGVSQAAVSQWCSNAQKPKRLDELADILKVNFQWLKKAASATFQDNLTLPVWGDGIAKEKSLESLHTGVRLTFDDPYTSEVIPILGSANGSEEAVMLNFNDPIGKVRRHNNQTNVKGAFALYTRGDSMFPRYEAGELVFLVPNRDVSPGQDCVVELNNGEAYLKKFVKKTIKEVICKQLNPAKEWKRPLSEVKAIHVVVGRG